MLDSSLLVSISETATQATPPVSYKAHAPSWDAETTALHTDRMRAAIDQAAALGAYGMDAAEIACDLADIFPELEILSAKTVAYDGGSVVWIWMGRD